MKENKSRKKRKSAHFYQVEEDKQHAQPIEEEKVDIPVEKVSKNEIDLESIQISEKSVQIT